MKNTHFSAFCAFIFFIAESPRALQSEKDLHFETAATRLKTILNVAKTSILLKVIIFQLMGNFK